MTEARRGMRAHHELVLRMVPQNRVARFMLEHGRDYQIGPDTYAGKRGEKGHCFMNASHLAFDAQMFDHDLTYVEGQIFLFGIAIDHAWCVTKDGFVVDPTLAPDITGAGPEARASDYFGVPFRTDYVRKACLANGVYGLLDYHFASKTAPKLYELGLEAGQQWLLDHKGKLPGRKRRAR